MNGWQAHDFISKFSKLLILFTASRHTSETWKDSVIEFLKEEVLKVCPQN